MHAKACASLTRVSIEPAELGLRRSISPYREYFDDSILMMPAISRCMFTTGLARLAKMRRMPARHAWPHARQALKYH